MVRDQLEYTLTHLAFFIAFQGSQDIKGISNVLFRRLASVRDNYLLAIATLTFALFNMFYWYVNFDIHCWSSALNEDQINDYGSVNCQLLLLVPCFVTAEFFPTTISGVISIDSAGMPPCRSLNGGLWRERERSLCDKESKLWRHLDTIRHMEVAI